MSVILNKKKIVLKCEEKTLCHPKVKQTAVKNNGFICKLYSEDSCIR